MATFTWEDVTPTLIPNTTMRKRCRDGVGIAYGIAPNDGYVLHVKGRDTIIYDEYSGEEIGVVFGYSSGEGTVNINYDFTPVTVTDENGVQHTAYGAVQELFARPASEVPADQIYGVGNDHEVM